MIHASRQRDLLTPISTGYKVHEAELSRILHAEDAHNVQT